MDVAQRCGLSINRAGDRTISPLRPGASNPSSFWVDDDFWYDFGDGRGGDCIDLLAELKHSGDRGRAIRELARITGVQDDNTGTTSAEWVEYTHHMNARTAYYQTQLTQDDRDYLHGRGLTDEDIDRLRIGRVAEGPLSGRLFLPYFQNGAVVYYATRAMPGSTHPDSKYMKQKRDEHCQHVPWGLQTLVRAEDHDTLVIAEGYFDAVSFEASGYPVISAVTGHFSKEQIPMVLSICRKFEKVFIVYDNDPKTHAGQRFTERMATLLTTNRIPFVVGTVPPPYHDVSEYYAAGGKPELLVNTAQDGVTYMAMACKTFEELEQFIYTIARHTKRLKMDELLSKLSSSSPFDTKLLTNLFRAATTAPSEHIIAGEIMRSRQLVYVNSVGFYEYTGGVWNRLTDLAIQGYADRVYGEFSTAQRIKAVAQLLKTRVAQDITFNAQPVWNFTNGTLELDTGVFRDHNPQDYCSVQASYPYDPEARCPNWERFIRDVTGDDPKKEELLQLIPGYALFSDCSMERMFVLSGAGGNGKSKYLEMLRYIFGEANTSHVQPSGLMDKFQLIQLRESIINIAGEIRSDFHGIEERLKAIASGEPVSACFKGEQFVTFAPRTKLLFATNTQLTSNDATDGLTRRLIVVDFPIQFVDFPTMPHERSKDIHLMERLLPEMQSGGVFNWVYAGYKLLRAVGYFTETDDQTEMIEDFKRSSNPVLSFYEEKIQPDMPAELTNEQLYPDYKEWCLLSGEKPLSKVHFGRAFKLATAREYEPAYVNRKRGYRRR